MSALLQIPINCEFALATLGLYDYCLTLDREIQHIWKRKFNWVSVLFCVNRYLVPIISIFIFWKNASSVPSGRSCTALVLAQMIVDILLSVCAAVFYATQTFALFERHILLLLLASVLGLSPPVISLCVWSIAASKSFSANIIGERCSSLSALESGAYDGWLVAARVTSLATNFLVLALVIIKARQITKLTTGLSLAKVLVEQGSLFFCSNSTPKFCGYCAGQDTCPRGKHSPT